MWSTIIAVFCSNDVGALQVWHRACECGIAVPGTLRIAGFDGQAQGMRAFEVLKRLVENEQQRVEETVPAGLLAGRST